MTDVDLRDEYRARLAERATDPDVLGLYADRLTCDLLIAAPLGVCAIEWAAVGDPMQQDHAQMRLTELGEQARPLRDEGVPCG